MQRFVLRRFTDETGLSGTGVVAEGVVFTKGHCVMTWLSKYHSVTVYDSIEVVEALHGHGGRAQVEWLD